MGICLQDYRARIGIFNTKCLSASGDIFNICISLYASYIQEGIGAVGHCLNYFIFLLWCLMVILSIPQVYLNKHPTISTHDMTVSMPINKFDAFCNSRIIFSAMIYCCVKLLTVNKSCIHSLFSPTKIKRLYKSQFRSLFKTKCTSDRLINIYSL